MAFETEQEICSECGNNSWIIQTEDYGGLHYYCSKCRNEIML